jgi:hypothetical protein
MKRFKLFFSLTMFVGLLFCVSMAFGAGTVVESREPYSRSYQNAKKIIFTCTGDASDGSIPNTTTSNAVIEWIGGMRLYQVDAFPTSGGTAPEPGDVFILDLDGMDMLGAEDGSATAYGGLNLIHGTLKRSAIPNLYNAGQDTHTAYYPIFTDGLILSVVNQTNTNANFTIEMMFVK